jgi:hypothetical protein
VHGTPGSPVTSLGMLVIHSADAADSLGPAAGTGRSGQRRGVTQDAFQPTNIRVVLPSGLYCFKNIVTRPDLRVW